MATLEATPGSQTANSYITVAQADDYATRTHPSKKAIWDAVTDKEQLLMYATTLIDNAYYWDLGWKSDTKQALNWPREFVAYEGRESPFANVSPYKQVEGFNVVQYYPNDVIPDFLVAATTEQAIAVATEDLAEPDGSAGIRSAKVENLSVTFESQESLSKGVIPPVVDMWLRRYGKLNPSLKSEVPTISTSKVVRY